MTRQRRTCIETNNAFISPNVDWLKLLTHNSRGQRAKCVRPSPGLSAALNTSCLSGSRSACPSALVVSLLRFSTQTETPSMLTATPALCHQLVLKLRPPSFATHHGEGTGQRPSSRRRPIYKLSTTKEPFDPPMSCTTSPGIGTIDHQRQYQSLWVGESVESCFPFRTRFFGSEYRRASRGRRRRFVEEWTRRGIGPYRDCEVGSYSSCWSHQRSGEFG
jgi:hypothetical protein